MNNLYAFDLKMDLSFDDLLMERIKDELPEYVPLGEDYFCDLITCGLWLYTLNKELELEIFYDNLPLEFIARPQELAAYNQEFGPCDEELSPCHVVYKIICELLASGARYNLKVDYEIPLKLVVECQEMLAKRDYRIGFEDTQKLIAFAAWLLPLYKMEQKDIYLDSLRIERQTQSLRDYGVSDQALGNVILAVAAYLHKKYGIWRRRDCIAEEYETL